MTSSFSSLPPSFSSFPDLDPGPSNSQSSRPNDGKPERRSKKDKHEKKQKKDRVKHVDKSTRRAQDWNTQALLNDEKLKAEEDRVRLEQEGLESRQLDSHPTFYSDRKGDALNVTYGHLHAGDIPKYHPVDRGRSILGLGTAWTVLRKGGKGIEITVGGRRKQPALTDSSSRALLLAAPTRRLIALGDSYKYQEIDGFLRLPSRRGRQTNEAYRAITLTKDNEGSDSQSSGSESDDTASSDDEGPLLTSHQLSLKELEAQLSSEPSLVSIWLALVAHSLFSIPVASKNATKTRAEVTLSVLSRALCAHPGNAKSSILRLKYLRAGEEIWHESKARAEWDEALKLGDIDIWLEWLEWRVRKGAGGVDGFISDAARILNALGDDEENEIDKLRLTWKITIGLQQAGFYERATALFQAQAELTFEVPQSLYGLPLENQLESLEEFWESEVPRIGEPGAKGWASWLSSGSPENNSPPTGRACMNVGGIPHDPYSEWHAAETHGDRTWRIPIRSTDDTNGSDPYATVLFSDIKPLLISLRTQRAKNAFRLIWLSLLGLHVPGFGESLSPGSWDDRWSYIHLLSDQCLAAILPSHDAQKQLTADAHAGVLVGREREYSSAFGPVKEWKHNTFGVLHSVGKEKWRLWTAQDLCSVDEEFTRALFQQLRCGADDCEWDGYALAFEAALNVKNALKLSRSFLSTARDSLLHWAIHAQLEHIRGRIDDARKVYQTVLTASSHRRDEALVPRLWADWAELEWLNRTPDAALQVVSQFAGVEGSSGMMILRAKRNLEDLIATSAGNWKDREALIKLRALIELLTATPESALAVIDSQPVDEREDVRESLTVTSLMLLYHHSITLRSPTPPSLLRDRLQVAIETFPNNTVILGMFLEGEKGYGVWGRVRALLGDAGANEKGVARRVAEVWVAGWEKGRWNSEIERTRSGLIAAVDSERTKGSPIIWRVILEFEIRAGQLQRAKSLLYRAVGECPLVKGEYMVMTIGWDA
ncbi:NRDE-2, necessary for RNA interference-domain-containing protein [Hygrophoropsis aurantiaca]|uniref:NRDE-2, necessary for RNA interference-domain-containing protein n=1 Tax=Hygrophoropsis aurantiaca TaxID=72124 RepID=A0ACB8AJ60_9AGAM|nr:NRDE-2, necessary for RNA interference-domain-containing protein [Hygrophoropsis aurantiaca]